LSFLPLISNYRFQITDFKFQITGIKPYTTNQKSKITITHYSKDEGIGTGASIPPGFAPALAELERGFTDRATPKTIPSSQLRA